MSSLVASSTPTAPSTAQLYLLDTPPTHGKRPFPMIVDIAVDNSGKRQYLIRNDSRKRARTAASSSQQPAPTPSAPQSQLPTPRLSDLSQLWQLRTGVATTPGDDVPRMPRMQRMSLAASSDLGLQPNLPLLGRASAARSTLVGSPHGARGSVSSASGAKDDEGEVWGKSVENAFTEALRLIPKHGLNKIKILGGKLCGRNELISDYIWMLTGKRRSRKQVLSHIQVIKNLGKDTEVIGLIEHGPLSEDCEARKAEFEEVFTRIHFQKTLGRQVFDTPEATNTPSRKVLHMHDQLPAPRGTQQRHASHHPMTPASTARRPLLDVRGVHVLLHDAYDVEEEHGSPSLLYGSMAAKRSHSAPLAGSAMFKPIELRINKFHLLYILFNKPQNSHLFTQLANDNPSLREPRLQVRHNPVLNRRFPHLPLLAQVIDDRQIPVVHNMLHIRLPAALDGKQLVGGVYESHLDFSLHGVPASDEAWSLLVIFYSRGKEVIRINQQLRPADGPRADKVHFNCQWVSMFWSKILSALTDLDSANDEQKSNAIRNITAKQIVFACDEVVPALDHLQNAMIDRAVLTVANAAVAALNTSDGPVVGDALLVTADMPAVLVLHPPKDLHKLPLVLVDTPVRNPHLSKRLLDVLSRLSIRAVLLWEFLRCYDHLEVVTRSERILLGDMADSSDMDLNAATVGLYHMGLSAAGVHAAGVHAGSVEVDAPGLGISCGGRRDSTGSDGTASDHSAAPTGTTAATLVSATDGNQSQYEYPVSYPVDDVAGYRPSYSLQFGGDAATDPLPMMNVYLGRPAGFSGELPLVIGDGRTLDGRASSYEPLHGGVSSMALGTIFPLLMHFGVQQVADYTLNPLLVLADAHGDALPYEDLFVGTPFMKMETDFFEYI